MTDIVGASRVGSARGCLRRSALVLFAVACSRDGSGTTAPATPPPVPRTVRAVAGAGTTDTIGAILSQALILEVRGDDARPAAGVIVRAEAAAPADPARTSERAVLVCTLIAPVCDGSASERGLFAAQRTDSVGRVKFAVRLGTVSGRATLRVTVPELGLVDSAIYTVVAGMPTRVRFTVRDTTLLIGARASLAPALRDRAGNVTATVVTATASGGVEVTPDGVATARDIGRALVVARSGALADTAFVSVIPAGRFAAYAPLGIGVRDAIVSVAFDGSALRILSSGNGSGDGGWPAWSPDGARLAFHGGYSTTQLFVGSTADDMQQVLRGPVSQRYPQWSADGRWIYFARELNEI